VVKDDKSAWRYVRTCSRVSCGVCEGCRQSAFYGAWIHQGVDVDRVLCSKCYEDRYEPEKAAERRAMVEASNAKRQADLALALEGKLPGAVITKSGAVLGPPEKSIGGLAYREVLRDGLYDTEAFDPPADKPDSTGGAAP
jgi:hypothetical protein